MNVKLIGFTGNARELLIFTKSTRLQMSPDLFENVMNMTDEQKAAEIEYIANTVPSSWEFVDYTFLITGVSRAFTHQFVRNRHGSYAQQTMRVLEMGNYDYVPTQANLESEEAMAILAHHQSVTQACYGELLKAGQAPEDARGILPTNIATNIVARFNLRTMSELAKSRTGGRTQGEFQKVINAMIDRILEVHPWAQPFLFPAGRDLFNEIEEFARREWPNDLLKRGQLLKIVDQLRKSVGGKKD